MFDDVLNDQRKVIFSQRKEVLGALNIFEFTDKLLDDEIDDLLNRNVKNYNFANDKITKNKLQSLLSNNDSEYINKVLSKIPQPPLIKNLHL